jgi:hypothetical protein
MSILMHTRMWCPDGLLSGLPLRFRIYPSTDNTPGGASVSQKATIDLPPGGWDEIDEAAKRILHNQLSARMSMQIIEAGYREKLKQITAGGADADAILDDLYPKMTMDDEDGNEIRHDEPENGAGRPEPETIDITLPAAAVTPEPATAPPPPPAAAGPSPAAAAPPAARDPEPPDPTDEPNLTDEARFRDAYEAEAGCGTPETKGECINIQLEAIKKVMTRKGYNRPLTEPVEKFSREKRKAFMAHLLTLPDTLF